MTQPLHFGAFRFEPAAGRLWNGPAEVRITPRAAAVLEVLVRHAGEPVTKQALFAAVWKDTVVSDDALATCIQELRKALDDDAKQPLYIETRHRQGYRFVASLVAAAAPVDVAAIAVLPFTDMSPERDQDYFCEGLAEELIDALTHVAGLRVASRSASFQFRGPGVDVREAGRQLRVGALLEGSVRNAGDRLLFTVQLFDVESGYHKWSQRFERPMGDVFAIQDEIAEAVATNLRGGAVSERERHGLRRLETAAEPYECYLRGRQSLHRLQLADLENSRRLFEQAISLDRRYAPAWAGVATVHAILFEWWGAHDEDLREADRASRTAMELAPELADAQLARGLVLSLLRQYDEAGQHFEAAARINPNLFDAYYYQARACFARGEIARSAELFQKASDVRREDYQSPSLLEQSLTMLGRVEEARAAALECIVRAEAALTLQPTDRRALALGSLALYSIDDRQRAFEWSRRSLELDPEDMSALVCAACLHARAGLKNEALQMLERVFARGWGKRDWVENDPDYDSLRDDPRFRKLLEKLK